MYVGNIDILNNLLSKFDTKSLHHAILLIGKRGTGKAAMINAIINKIISKHHGEITPEQHINMVKSNSHPDIFHFGDKSSENDDLSKMTVDGARKVIEFTANMPSILPAKFVVIDSINDMNISACNAMLKMLEEPRNNTYFFITCHNAGSLMQTIKSRCFKVYLKDLSFDQAVDIFASSISDSGNTGNSKPLCLISDNSPGDALFLEKINGMELYSAFLSDIFNKTNTSSLLMQKISAVDIMRILEIFVNRFYKILIFTNDYKTSNLAVVSEERVYYDMFKKLNFMELSHSYSRVMKVINDINALNQPAILSFQETTCLLSGIK